PILARPASSWYQLTKFARRNRTLVGGIAATVVALVGGIVASLVLLQRANEETFRANRENENARRKETEAMKAEEQRRLEAANALANAAQLSARTGDWRTALNQYDKALELGHPDDVGIRLGKLLCYDATMDPRILPEIEALSQRTDLGRRAGSVLLWQARLSLYRRQTSGSFLDLMRQALAQGLPLSEAAYARAYLATTIPATIHHLQEAGREYPYNGNAYEPLVFYLFVAGRHDEVKQTLAQLRAIRPESSAALMIEAVMSALEGNDKATEAVLKKINAQMGPDTLAVIEFLLQYVRKMFRGDFLDLMDSNEERTESIALLQG